MKRIVIFALCTTPFAAMAQEEEDKGYLTEFLEESLSGAGRTITINGFEGALSSEARIAELIISDDEGAWLTLRDVQLSWQRTALFSGSLSVERLTAAEIILERLPQAEADDSLPAPEATPFSLPELPVSVSIGQLGADRIVLGESVIGQPIEATLSAQITLAGGEGQASLTLERTDDGPDGKFILAAGYTNASGILKLDLDLSEGADGIAATMIGLPGTPAIGLSVQGEGPIADYAADFSLTSDGQERLAGQAKLAATENGGNRFDLDLAGDIAPLFMPVYAEFFGTKLQIKARGERAADGALAIENFGLQAQAMNLRGVVDVGADGIPRRFDITGQIGLDGSAIVLPLTTDVPTAIKHANLALAFDAGKGDEWTADIRMLGLDREDMTLEEATLRGSGTISGIGQVPELTGKLDFTAQGVEPSDPALGKALGKALDGAVAFRWRQGDDTLQLPELKLNGADYGLDSSLTIAGLQEALTVTGQAKLDTTDLSRFADLAGQPLAGALSGTFGGEVALLSGGFDITGQIAGKDLKAGITELDNLLNGDSTVKFGVARDETGTVLRELAINASDLTARANGRLASSGYDLTADVAMSDLAALGGQYGGAVNGTLRFTGLPEDATVAFTGQTDRLTIGIPEVDNLLSGQSTVTAEAQLKGETVDLKKLEVDAASLSLDANGTIAASGSDVSASFALDNLRNLGASYGGSLTATARFSGTPENGTLTAEATGRQLRIGQAEADRLLAGESRLVADLKLDGRRIKINSATLRNPQLDIRADGTVDGNKRQVNLEATLTNLATLLAEFPGRLSVRGTAVDDGSNYTLDLRAEGPGGIAGTARGTVANSMQSADLRIQGAGEAALANPFISPRTTSGRVSYDLTLRGSLQLSSLGGQVNLSDIRLADPSLPAALTGFGGTIRMSGAQANLALEGGLTTGGTISVSGPIGMTAPFNANLSSRLTQVVVKDPNLYETRLDGALTVVGALAGGATIAGDIFLKETELRVPSTSLASAAGLDAVQHVNESAAVRSTRSKAGLLEEASGGSSSSSAGRPYPLNIRISAPQRIFIRGRGLDAELGGELRVQGTTNDVVPSGRFELVRGRLDILGKRLTLSEALLQLQGSFDPFIRILASTESDGIISSVMIEGLVSEPKVSFVSQPELPEEEVLSRLLFGRDLTSLSAFQAAQLASAVATLAGKGGDGIMSKLRKGFGLDDLDVSTNAEGETSLKAGKYISSRAYTEVEVDQGGQAKINLNLDLSKSVTLRGSVAADGETSIGIFKEKDY